MAALDGKVYGVLHKVKDNSVIPPDQFVVFLAKDNAFVPTLEFYYEECQRIGASVEQCAAVQVLIAKVKRWREDNPEMCKIADVDPGELSNWL